jgi:hypothetical protein
MSATGKLPQSTLDWLSSYDEASTHFRQSAIRRHGTAEWILKAPDVAKWLSGNQSSCLWCSGNGMLTTYPAKR